MLDLQLLTVLTWNGITQSVVRIFFTPPPPDHIYYAIDIQKHTQKTQYKGHIFVHQVLRRS